jgi:DNA-binding XRE family transcriptional regulator
MPRKPELSQEDQASRERLGAAIRIAAATRNMKPADLAKAGGVSLAHQYRIESGERTPDALYLMKIARLLGVSLDELCWGKSDQELVPGGPKEVPQSAAGVGGIHADHVSGGFNIGSVHGGSVTQGAVTNTGSVTFHPPKTRRK